MKASHGTTPIPLPGIVDDPKWIGRLSRDIRKSIAALRDRKVIVHGNSARLGGGASACYFGEIITVPDSDPEKKAIRGGVIYCGDKNFHVDAQELTLTSDIERMVQIKITGVTANTDDDGELILPGVETATGTPEWENKTGTAYDDNTNPTATTPGTVIIPIGKLVIADGAATLDATGCGNIRVSQCAGTLTVDRP